MENSQVMLTIHLHNLQEIDKIPYTPNEKRDFRALEELGNTIVKERKGKVLTKKL